MRAIVVMFDSLNRHYLPQYAPDCGIDSPNFRRLAERTVQFDKSYVGSMPCMPARRELHTGRYNFLHRSWGPMEPFDDSVPQMLQDAGVATHLATDHLHYWEDGGATYHTRYGTCSLIRGQQGDPWKGWVADPKVDNELRIWRGGRWRQDRINREYISGLSEYPQTRTFDAGIEFIKDNAAEQNWFVQIETFDPHEPFNAAEEFENIYGAVDPTLPSYDWPQYQQVLEESHISDAVRKHYAALVSQCDASLGRVLDTMDEHDLWSDTLLIVCTDHGFLLGEHERWGKGTPWFEETAHTPLFVWDPVAKRRGMRNDALVQTIDIAPTLLDHFGLEATPRMEGQSLREAIVRGTNSREYAMFGSFGGHVSITDGRHTYMRASINESNMPLNEHTLMPTHMLSFFTPAELASAELIPALPFTRGMPVLRTDAPEGAKPYAFGTLLFDLDDDPRQESPIVDDTLELRLAQALVDAMRANDAPVSQFERLGLPHTGPVGSEHLLAKVQHGQAVAARKPPPSTSSFPAGKYSVHSTVGEVMADIEAASMIRHHGVTATVGPFARIAPETTLYRAAPSLFGAPASAPQWEKLHALLRDLADLCPSSREPD